MKKTLGFSRFQEFGSDTLGYAVATGSYTLGYAVATGSYTLGYAIATVDRRNPAHPFFDSAFLFNAKKACGLGKLFRSLFFAFGKRNRKRFACKITTRIKIIDDGIISNQLFLFRSSRKKKPKAQTTTPLNPKGERPRLCQRPKLIKTMIRYGKIDENHQRCQKNRSKPSKMPKKSIKTIEA